MAYEKEQLFYCFGWMIFLPLSRMIVSKELVESYKVRQEKISSRRELLSSRRELLSSRRELLNPRRELSKPRRELKNCCLDLKVYRETFDRNQLMVS